MIYSSLAVLAMSATAAIGPFTNLIHLHPKPAQTDNRVSVEIFNKGITFRDVKIDGHIYTLQAHHGITVKAPVGTVVYADTPTPAFHHGDAILEVSPSTPKVVIN